MIKICFGLLGNGNQKVASNSGRMQKIKSGKPANTFAKKKRIEIKLTVGYKTCNKSANNHSPSLYDSFISSVQPKYSHKIETSGSSRTFHKK